MSESHTSELSGGMYVSYVVRHSVYFWCCILTQ